MSKFQFTKQAYPEAASATDLEILDLLKIKPSSESLDYVNNQTQFQLHSLVTEQSNKKTWNLSGVIKQDIENGLEQLLLVDEDISQKISEISKNPILIEQASKSVESAILEGRKIYIYGCGATGRLAIQVESAFWRPFWARVKSNNKIWDKLKDCFEGIENRLSGVITGADRAMVSSLEGFEDLQVIGKLQLQDHNIEKGDVVFAVTEGGETSSVIGAILAAQAQYGELTEATSKFAKNNLYFIFNNPNNVLMPLDRSRQVLESNAITKISLCTGPQAITGSTRMQATTISTFIVGIILENAIDNVLRQHLSVFEMASLGFVKNLNINDRIQTFISVQQSVYQIKGDISRLIDLESSTYAKNKFSTYFANKALAVVFIDSTERSPTFNLVPLDSVEDKERKSWIQVWTGVNSQESAWCELLGRDFCGLDNEIYKEYFDQIPNQYLKEAALRSLKNAGPDQRFLYDFSFAEFNINNKGPQTDDLGIIVLLHNEIDQLSNDESEVVKWLKLFSKNGAKTAAILISFQSLPTSNFIIKKIHELAPKTLIVPLVLNINYDPLLIREQIALKMLLNSHSTAVMAKLGRIVGNVMAYVKPGNLKLIGRATYLIQTLVNESLSKSSLGKGKNISYREANAVLFDVMEYIRKSPDYSGNPEVALVIIRILEAFKMRKPIHLDEAKNILQAIGLEEYLLGYR